MVLFSWSELVAVNVSSFLLPPGFIVMIFNGHPFFIVTILNRWSKTKDDTNVGDFFFKLLQKKSLERKRLIKYETPPRGAMCHNRVRDRK